VGCDRDSLCARHGHHWKGAHVTDFGAFIEVEEGIDGLVHVSDMS